MSGDVPWRIFTNSGRPPADGRPVELPEVPRWRTPKPVDGEPWEFVLPKGLDHVVNAALHLRRPLLLTGPAGSGKSTLAWRLAEELGLGPLLKWHITSKSVRDDGLFQYDALGRLHESQRQGGGDPKIGDYVTLGPLGTALASQDRPRVVLIDEIDKSDLDLPGDLLDVLENGEFTIPPLARVRSVEPFRVVGSDQKPYDIPASGVVRRKHFPVIVFTSNQERTFAPPFLRRCVRFTIDNPDRATLVDIVKAHLGADATGDAAVESFARRLESGETIAVNQLLDLLHLVTGQELGPAAEKVLRDNLTSDLTGP
ncbi:AAA family ATPase [Actinomadura rayongensis]|uniref:AAA domain-containing protein n=1 Tax=Actinomadura rayongensis TaxID=1429076 RepID=A0A6I4W1L5_9ACTN|nr:AAA family ATPase [Actinomadura rayongensis]MXQ64459.1 AAA domain-containing protein [Actinomadura rayongensis]